ncbi:hypothetical protein KTT_04830 [Tengunoibacter tsumagoiensis]|uniref:Uncharacterized protein n=1 Tax=Tengunoibacter tsumagoiensis TaxID=2014871 RepID=A0A401ZV75_9CHLR|nr:hypothetical protein KTT_04830 [Tengunoibacter tsumagoiensis]
MLSRPKRIEEEKAWKKTFSKNVNQKKASQKISNNCRVSFSRGSSHSHKDQDRPFW